MWKIGLMPNKCLNNKINYRPGWLAQTREHPAYQSLNPSLTPQADGDLFWAMAVNYSQH